MIKRVLLGVSLAGLLWACGSDAQTTLNTPECVYLISNNAVIRSSEALPKVIYHCRMKGLEDDRFFVSKDNLPLKDGRCTEVKLEK